MNIARGYIQQPGAVWSWPQTELGYKPAWCRPVVSGVLDGLAGMHGWRARTYPTKKGSFQRTQCKYAAGLLSNFFLMENCFLTMLSGITCNAALLPLSGHSRLHPTPKIKDHWLHFTFALLLLKHFSHCLHVGFVYSRDFFDNARQCPWSRSIRLQCLPLYVAFI